MDIHSYTNKYMMWVNIFLVRTLDIIWHTFYFDPLNFLLSAWPARLSEWGIKTDLEHSLSVQQCCYSGKYVIEMVGEKSLRNRLN